MDYNAIETFTNNTLNSSKYREIKLLETNARKNYLDSIYYRMEQQISKTNGRCLYLEEFIFNINKFNSWMLTAVVDMRLLALNMKDVLRNITYFNANKKTTIYDVKYDHHNKIGKEYSRIINGNQMYFYDNKTSVYDIKRDLPEGFAIGKIDVETIFITTETVNSECRNDFDINTIFRSQSYDNMMMTIPYRIGISEFDKDIIAYYMLYKSFVNNVIEPYIQPIKKDIINKFLAI